MRLTYWDAWKGLAIVAVTLIHATRDTADFPVGSFNWYTGLVIRQALNFAVPTFLLLAGYFAAGSEEVSGRRYVTQRLLRVLLPYVIWSLVAIALHEPESLRSVKTIARELMLGTGIGVGYFVIVMAQYIVITPWILRIRRPSMHLMTMLAMTAAAQAYIYWIRAPIEGGELSRFPLNVLPFFLWYPFFHLGIWARQVGLADTPWLKRTGLTLIALWCLLTLLAVAEGIFHAARGNFDFGVSQVKASSVAASVAMALVIFSRFGRSAWPARSRILAWLGVNSYFIYLTHMLFLPLARSVVNEVDGAFEVQAIYIASTAAITLSASAALAAFMRRCVPASVASRYLGL